MFKKMMTALHTARQLLVVALDVVTAAIAALTHLLQGPEAPQA